MMLATQTLPPSYHLSEVVDVSKDQKLLIALNGVGLMVMVGFGFFYLQWMVRIRPEDTVRSLNALSFNGILPLLRLIIIILLLTGLFTTLHEAVHGVFFWIFTRSQPKFAFRWSYAYAAAPSWYITRIPFLCTTLAPLVILTLLGSAVLPIIPASWLMPIWFMVVMNASGAVGDLLVAYRLLKHPASTLVQDRGDAVSFFIQGE